MASAGENSTESSASHLFPTVMANSAELADTQSGSNPGKDDGGGLSGGAIAGIVIGVVVSLPFQLSSRFHYSLR